MAKKKETAKRTCTATELPDDPHRTKKKKKNDDEVYVVEDIVDFRTKGNQKEWLVKWKGQRKACWLLVHNQAQALLSLVRTCVHIVNRRTGTTYAWLSAFIRHATDTKDESKAQC